MVDAARDHLDARRVEPAVDGMVVHTESQEARETRKFVLEMLLSDHPNQCMTCEVNGDCDLQDLVYDYGVPWPEPNGARHTYDIDPDPNPFVFIDRNKCVLCSRCIRACGEMQNRDVWNSPAAALRASWWRAPTSRLLDARCEIAASAWRIARSAHSMTR